MNNLFLICYVVLLSGCAFHTGVAYHPRGELNDFDSNPLGVVRGTMEGYNGVQLFCEHVSSIPDNDKGLNMCVALIRVY